MEDLHDKYRRVRALKDLLETRASDPEADSRGKYHSIASEGLDLVKDLQEKTGYSVFSFSDLCWWNGVKLYFS